ncbi:hypothetical protein CK203_045545 [Vitis vinifera]|uniref:Uncharacterized protein n=1 Tax=Vitis vinifera TaxID=29760 RepID=A0A438HLJ3_VITVI|nr:hypothetical protein CK203_045545 [Vitis vinifera]
MRCGGKALESFEAIGTFKDTLGNGWVEVFVDVCCLCGMLMNFKLLIRIHAGGCDEVLDLLLT